MLILLNGVQVEEKEANLGLNRAMRYGDGVFETIMIKDGEPSFWDEHLNRLVKGLKWLKIRIKEGFEKKIKDEVYRLLRDNNINDFAVLRIYAFRGGGGKYTPQENTINYLAQVQELDAESLEQKRGLSIDLTNEIYIHTSQNYSFKTLNAIPYVRASIEKTERGLDELILVNEHHRLVEACSSNIFLYLDKMWQTPSLEEGCLDGVIRKKILDHFKENAIPHRVANLDSDSLARAEEVFLTNSIEGIRWVKSFRTKRYFHRRTDDIKNFFY